MRATSKWHFVSGLTNGSFEIPRIGTLATLGTHNFVCRPLIAMRSQKKVIALIKSFEQYVAHQLNMRKLGRFLTFSGR
jgi:hypothetical protein